MALRYFDKVKSSAEAAHVRMAIGQLYDYWFNIKGRGEEHLAVLVPEVPAQPLLDMLSWLGIGAMWFEGSQLRAHDDWLKHLVC